MLRILFATLATTVAIVPYVFAQQPVYAQCGGNGWTGQKSCAAGSYCKYSNDWYSQCIPGTAPTTAPPTAPPTTAPVPTTTKPTTTKSTTSTPAPAPTSGGPNYWFSFGDSYTTTGFDTNGTLPNSAYALGNPPFPGYTGAGGENWVGYLTLTYNNSLVYTYNYAYGGATIDASLVTPYLPTVLSLIDQVNLFSTTAAKKPPATPWTTANSLFSVWIGINDIGNSYYNSGDRGAFSDTLLNAYFAQVQRLYVAGARNFLFVNVPPIDRSPLMLAQPASAQAAEDVVIQGFNSKLAAKITAFKAANPGVTTWSYDAWTQFTQILDSPTTYGFQDATTYGTGTNIFWGNNYHPGVSAHNLFAQKVKSILAGTVW